jgi:hypothetical protein
LFKEPVAKQIHVKKHFDGDFILWIYSIKYCVNEDEVHFLLTGFTIEVHEFHCTLYKGKTS